MITKTKTENTKVHKQKHAKQNQTKLKQQHWQQQPPPPPTHHRAHWKQNILHN